MNPRPKGATNKRYIMLLSYVHCIIIIIIVIFFSDMMRESPV